MSLEVPRVPQFANQLPKPCNEWEHGQPLSARSVVDVAVIAWVEEIVSKWSNVR